jgi:hypothetical protein
MTARRFSRSALAIVVTTVAATLVIGSSSAWAAPPPNDDFANAEALTGMSDSASGTNVGATMEQGEPSHGGQGGASIWYRWTAPRTGPFRLETCGSDFDTVAAVYTGTQVDDLELIAGNDNSGGVDCPATDQSELYFRAVEGTTYSIAVAGWDYGLGPAMGNAQLALQQSVPAPANDNFASAETLPSDAIGDETTGYTWFATSEPGEPDHAGESNGESVWFRWTAPAPGTVSFDTCGPDFDPLQFDTVLAAYVGSSVNNLVGVASNDDAAGCSDFGSRIVFPVTPGVTYSVAVAGFDVDAFPEEAGWFWIRVGFLRALPQCPACNAPPGVHANIRKIKVDSQRRIAKVYFGGDRPDARFLCQLDNGKARVCRSPVVFGKNKTWPRLSVGRHTVRVTGVDPQGREETAPPTRHFRVKPG